MCSSPFNLELLKNEMNFLWEANDYIFQRIRTLLGFVILICYVLFTFPVSLVAYFLKFTHIHDELA